MPPDGVKSMNQHSTLKIRTKNPWIPYRRLHTDASLKLFCFPYAGGSASIYREWFDSLPSWIDICPIQLPGREGRLLEKPITSIPLIIDELVKNLGDELNQDYAIFGHSMGALIGFEFARALSQKGKSPVVLFVSGRNAPQIKREKMVHKLPDDEFLMELKRLNGTPQQVLEHKELMELLLPIIRADFEAFETYKYVPKAPLTCPIVALGGIEDYEVPQEQLQAWKEHTISRFKIEMLEGDHFFIHQQKEKVLQIILQELAAFLK